MFTTDVHGGPGADVRPGCGTPLPATPSHH